MAQRKKFDITKGDVLSVDPGTTLCGVALWRDGRLLATTVLRSTGYNETVSERLRQISTSLKAFLSRYEASVTVVISENPPHTLLKAVIGAILMTDGVDSMYSDSHTVGVSEWKAWAKRLGAAGPFGLIKGVAALRSTGFNVTSDMNDDIADAIMVYLAYRDKYNGHKALNRATRGVK